MDAAQPPAPSPHPPSPAPPAPSLIKRCLKGNENGPSEERARGAFGGYFGQQNFRGQGGLRCVILGSDLLKRLRGTPLAI